MSGRMRGTTAVDQLVGHLLDGRYEVRERIARGGMATVYRAVDTRLDRVVAVKVMHRHLADDEAFAARFVREARSVARLNNPGVVAVFDQGEDEGSVYLVMEDVPGRTLRDVVRDDAPLPTEQCLMLTERIAVALAAAHAAGIVHRDVKPENVLLGEDGAVKVADFGLARALQSGAGQNTATATGGLLIGTVSYLAPELVLGKAADPRSDVYACGIVLYELLTGAKPHLGETPIQVAYQHVHSDVPAPSLAEGVPLGSIPDYVDALVARATARDRDLRPTDAGVLVRQLRMVHSALVQGQQSDPGLADDLRPRPSGSLPGAGTATADDAVRRPHYLVEPAPAPQAPAPSQGDGDERTLVVAATNGSAPRSSGPSAPSGPSGPSRPSGSTRRQLDTGRTDPQRRRRRGWWLLVAVLVLAIAAGGAGWWFGVGRYTDTPRLLQMTEREAGGVASRAGLSVQVEDTVFSERVPEGAVVTTDPGPGDRIEDGGTVALTLSRGKERLPVPPLVGVPATDAAELLEDDRLAVGEQRREYSLRVDEGVVTRTSIAAGTRVKPGTEVDLWVSRGPRPIEVEDFTGQPADEAEAQLREAGFTVRVREDFNDEVDAGLVAAQTPSSGTSFKGEVVRLVVSKGPAMVEVPGVVSNGVEAARAALEAAGFKVEEAESDLYAGLGFVVQQSPSGGELAPAGSTITIYLV